MTLACTGCGREVPAGRWEHEGDACGARIITREAKIYKGPDGDLVWQQQETVPCTGLLERRGPA